MKKYYWIWNEGDGGDGWWKARGWGLTKHLHEAYQYEAAEAYQIEGESNQYLTDDEYPTIVLIPVTDSFLPKNQRAALAATLADGAPNFDELDALVKSLEELEAKKK